MHAIDTWLKARREYVSGRGFLPEIARKFSIPVATVQTRAKREKWSTARRAFIESKTKLPDFELPPAPKPPLTGTDSVARTLNRLEMQLARIDDMLDTQTDVPAIDRLASAKSRLLEQWRILSGIPLPGSRRPMREKRYQRPIAPIPLDGETDLENGELTIR